MLDVQSFGGGVDCDTYHYLVVATVRESLAVSKQAARKFDGERFNLRNDVRQTKIHTAEPLVPEPSAFEVELAIEEPKSHKLPGTDQIPAELVKAGDKL